MPSTYKVDNTFTSNSPKILWHINIPILQMWKLRETKNMCLLKMHKEETEEQGFEPNCKRWLTSLTLKKSSSQHLLS